jgi:hypothetical protein
MRPSKPVPAIWASHALWRAPGGRIVPAGENLQLISSKIQGGLQLGCVPVFACAATQSETVRVRKRRRRRRHLPSSMEAAPWP